MELDNLFFNQYLDRTITFVRFAEAKNASLMGANLALLISAVNNMEMIHKSQLSTILAFVYFITVIIVFFETARSFYPMSKTKLRTNNSVNFERDDFNIFYYGHTRLINASQMASILKKKAGLKDDINGIHFDICEQIIQNSKICEAKMKIFRRTVTIFVVSAGLLTSSLVMAMV